MMGFPVSAHSTSLQPSGLMSFLMQRTAHVHLSPGVRFGVSGVRGHTQPPSPPPAFVRVLLHLCAPALTASVTIGRVYQTR